MNGTQQFAPSQMPPGGMAGGPPGMGGGPRAFWMLPGGPMTSMVVLGLFVITLIVLAIVFYKLFAKAGLNGAMGLLMLVPVVNLGVALYLAFTEWPTLAELARVKLQLASLGSLSEASAAVPTATPASTGDPAVPVSA